MIKIFPRSLRNSFWVALMLTLPAASLAQGTGYWHTSGNKLYDANNAQVRITGINWYGFETTRAVPGGLTSQDYKTILQTIKSLGYNTVRIPMSNQMVESPSDPSSISYSNGSGAINTDLQGLNSLQILDKIVSYAGTVGLKIILDNHRSEAGDSAESSGLWYTGSYPESAWINDWTALVNRYLNNPTVVGVDLRNEPHNAFSGGACWDCGGVTDWHLAAERAGDAVLAVNPKLLIFVEGTDAYTSSDYYWWGGNLEGVTNSPVVLSVANQLVYSAHDYGPSVYGQSWFNGSTTAVSLAQVWTTHWGFVAKNNTAPIWLGEFGTPNDAASVQSSSDGSEGQWFQSLVGYLGADTTLSWSYWALNGEDSLALLDANYDATPVNSTKQSMLASIQFALNPGSGTTTPAPAAPTNLTASATSPSAVNLSWTASSTSGVTYTLYEGTTSGVTNTVLASGITGTSYAASGLNASTTYYFTVKAVSTSAGASSASTQASATTKAAPAPNAPSGLSAMAASSSQINLTWSASSTSGVTYNVYAGTTAGATTSTVASGVSGTSYSVTGLAAASTYYFTVKAATTAGGLSAASNQASAATQKAAVPAAPSGLTAMASSSSQVNLAWSASSISGVTYTLYSGTSAGATNTVLVSGLGATSYSATGLTSSTTYYYTVKAVSSGGTASAASNQASATTQASAAAGACHVAYLDQNDWGSGFTGNLSITNSGPSAINSWVVTWSYAGNQEINQSWNSNYTQSGKNVSLTNATWNGAIAAGQTLTGIGWNANYSGANTNPTSFYLNGVLCK